MRADGWVEELFVYPVKGLSAQPLECVELQPGKGIPHDRTFAFARPDGKYRPGTLAGLPKQEFFALVSVPVRRWTNRHHADPGDGALVTSGGPEWCTAAVLDAVR